MLTAKKLARMLHQICEELAPEFDHKAKHDLHKVWEDIPADRKKLMMDTGERLLGRLGAGGYLADRGAHIVPCDSCDYDDS